MKRRRKAGNDPIWGPLQGSLTHRSTILFGLLILYCFSVPDQKELYGQDDDEECGQPDGWRVERLLKKGRDKGGDKIRERNEQLEKAIEKDPECAECHKQLADNLFTIAEQKPRVSYNSAEEHYLKALDLCPELHSNIYFRLGLIHYGRKDYDKAIGYFQDFLDFNVDDDAKYGEDYAKKFKDTEEIIPELKARRNLHENKVPFDPRIVKGVSTRKADEYLPTLSRDNELIFYTRRYRKETKNEITAKRVEELTVSERPGPEGQFSDGKALSAPFNQDDKENYGGASISVDNKELYVTICKPGKKGYKNCDIYRSDYELTIEEDGDREYEWSKPKNLGPAINTETGWESQPSISADGETLYFATIRKETRNADIYVSHRKENGEWSEAESIGDRINTEGDEKAPFIHSDSETLYFSSNDRIGAGGYDIYFSRRKEDSAWSEPKNLGLPINTKDDEIGLIVSTDGRTAYFSSSRLDKSKGLDIYAFDLPPRAKPEEVKLVKGEVRDEEGDVVQGAEVELKNPSNDEVTRTEVDSADGKFAAIIKAEGDDDVMMSVEKDGYAFKARAFGPLEGGMDTTRKGSDGGSIEKTEVKMERLREGEPYRLDDIHYATNSADLKERSKKLLDEFIEYLERNPSLKVAIHGHTDNVGSKDHNQALSHDRAFTVMSYLIEKGIDGSRLEFKGFGESRPIESNQTSEGRAENRRTEFVVLEK